MQEKIIIRTASEILASRKSITIENVMRMFDNVGEQVEIAFIGAYISDDLKIQLFNLGFKYRTCIDPIGLTSHIISLT